jgi:precorrin-8X/cobalt-precorrin-8 methylmutase
VLADRLSDLVARGKRVLVGVDFALGYPAGFAARIAPAKPDWLGVWKALAARLRDAPDNANNRFEAAATLNADLSGRDFPFWGVPAGRMVEGVSARRPAGFGNGDLEEFRLCEARAAGCQPVWKLCYPGSVGGQTLLGIPRLLGLRHHPWFGDVTRVWPFETGLQAPSEGQVILAEVYPSLLPVHVPEGSVRDAQQVTGLARHFAQFDERNRLAELFAGDPTLTPEQRASVEREEGWILGVVGGMALRHYLRDPQAIYAASWDTIRRECDLSRLPPELTDVALRVVHSCGMIDVVDDLACSPGAVEAGRAALRAGKPVLVDVEMVAHGVIRRMLPAGNEVVCTLNHPDVPDLAASLDTTRSAAAVELWRDRLEGAVVAIGNAPTALFHLLERLEEGWPKPAVVVGFPVGFVGAVESKQALALNRFGIPYVTLHGRRGGSAMAAAAVNALAGGAA